MQFLKITAVRRFCGNRGRKVKPDFIEALDQYVGEVLHNMLNKYGEDESPYTVSLKPNLFPKMDKGE